MNEAEEPSRPLDDVDDTPDWDLSVPGLDTAAEPQSESLTEDAASHGSTDADAAADAAPADGVSADDLANAYADAGELLLVGDQLLPDEVEDELGDAPIEVGASEADSYQTHFLDDEEPEAEYVAHVDPRETEVVHVRSGADALTEAMVSERAPAAPPVMDTDEETSKPVGDDDESDQEAAGAADSDAAASEPDPDEIADEAAEVAAAARPAVAPSRRFRPVRSKATAGIASNEANVSADLAEDSPEFEHVDDIPDADLASELAETDDAEAMVPAAAGGGWTIPLLCLGIAIIAFCMVVPQADVNRRLDYERDALRDDLESIQTQVATNDEFLRRLASDPALAERLAQRQLGLQRAGTRALAIGLGADGTSPFNLVQVSPPNPPEPYEPLGGKLAAVCRDSRSRLYLMGAGLFVLAAGLILGVAPPPRDRLIV